MVRVEGSSAKAKDLEAKLHALGNFTYKDLTLGEVLNDLRTNRGLNIFIDTIAGKSNVPVLRP